MKRILAVFAAATLLTACDDSGTNPPDVDVLGTYLLTELGFDPQGSLPAVDLLARLQTGTIPRLVIGTTGRAQLVFEHPTTHLITIAPASYSITSAGDVRIDFGSGSSTLYRTVMLSEEMTFAFDSTAHTLRFSGESPDGIDRASLLDLVPEWVEEQLFDPVPGVLTVNFAVGTT